MDRSHSGLNRRNLLLRGSAVAAVASGWPVAALAQASTLRAAITGYTVIDILDPGKATLIPEFYVIEGLYNALMKLDAKMNPVPDLAESVKASDDGALEFRLRQGVQFHDGGDLTSDDVKFTIERLLDENFELASQEQGVSGRSHRNPGSAHRPPGYQGTFRAAPHLSRKRPNRDPDFVPEVRRSSRRRLRQKACRYRRLHAEGLAAR